jgi:hypothetical protein
MSDEGGIRLCNLKFRLICRYYFNWWFPSVFLQSAGGVSRWLAFASSPENTSVRLETKLASESPPTTKHSKYFLLSKMKPSQRLNLLKTRMSAKK